METHSVPVLSAVTDIIKFRGEREVGAAILLHPSKSYRGDSDVSSLVCMSNVKLESQTQPEKGTPIFLEHHNRKLSSWVRALWPPIRHSTAEHLTRHLFSALRG